MSRAFFSIILPAYNRASLLPGSIGSVIKQSYQDWELVVVDDGSTDNTQDVVKSFNDPRIKYVYQNNSERSAARNKGIDNASGTWICFLDSDDEYQPEHLQELVQFIEVHKPLTGLIATGLITRERQTTKHKAFLELEKNSLEEIGSKFLIPTQVCVHRTVLEKDRFDVRYRLWEDTHLWLRIAAQYPVYQMDKYTTIQNIHAQGTVVQGMKKIRLTEVNQYILVIQDLRDNYSAIFEGKLPPNYFNEYIGSKYRMYLYQARQNQQFRVAHHIWFKAWQHRPSWYLFSECPKITLNYLNIGLHAR